MIRIAFCILTILFSGVAIAQEEEAVRPKLPDSELPPARWDSHPKALLWTRTVLSALETHGQPLVALVPRDIADWCPVYPEAAPGQRQAFWTGLLSALAWHESTFRPYAVDPGGRWFGLLQIQPSTARGYKCLARSSGALKEGAANLSCGIRIMAVTVPRDGVISRGMRGVAADWGPFHSRKKRTDMMEWTKSQEYCQVVEPIRPEPRPRSLLRQEKDQGQ